MVTRAMSWGYSAIRLDDYIQWVFLSGDRWPRWMRKPGRSYLGLENLLRRSHLRTHMREALAWVAEKNEQTIVIYDGQQYGGEG